MTESVAPVSNSLWAPHLEAAAKGVLLLPWCIATARHFWPPSPSSPFVTAGPVEWQEADRIGVLRSLIVYRRVFQQAFADCAPYGIGLVELASGVRLQAHVAALESGQAPSAGSRMEIYFEPIATGGIPVAHARLAQEQD
jgi:uncharacterized protein